MPRSTLTVAGSVVLTVVFVVALAARWGELSEGIAMASALVVVAAVALQIVALVSRSEAWFVCVRAAGGTMDRRRLYRASSMGCAGSLVNGHLGTAARITALRRSAPEESPRVPALIAAELPILVVEAMLAALTSFTLVGPLGLPWWTPLVCFAGVAAVSMAVGAIARAGVAWLRNGLAVLRGLSGRNRLVAFVLVAVFAQIARNWLLLHAVGVDASIFDAVAVLIAVVTLGQLPLGLGLGAAAAVLILGPQGVAAAAAAGLLLTATGTVGGLCFLAWAGVDKAWYDLRPGRLLTRLGSALAPARETARGPWAALAALPARRRGVVETAYFGGLSHMQIMRVLGVPAA